MSNEALDSSEFYTVNKKVSPYFIPILFYLTTILPLYFNHTLDIHGNALSELFIWNGLQ